MNPSVSSSMSEEIKKRYNIHWVGRCCYEGSDKVWGWFTYLGADTDTTRELPYSYVFWAATGKTLQFKKHGRNRYEMQRLVRTKMDRKYKEITLEELESHWSDFYSSMNDKFFFHLLADDI